MATDIIVEQIPSTQVRDDIDAVIEHAQETKQPIVVMRNGKAAVVIVDIAEYQRIVDERELFRAIAVGKMSKETYTLEEVEAELDALLAE